MKRKTRLSRKETSKKVNRLDKVRDAVVSELRAEDTKTVKNYAKMKDKAVIDNPTLALLKAEALNELARRQSTMSEWSTGKLPPVAKKDAKPKESFIRKLVHGEKIVAGLVGKGFQEYMKVISGEKAREFSEGIATIGMKPEDKKKFLEAERVKQKEAEKKELEEERSYYPGYSAEDEELKPKFVVAAKPELVEREVVIEKPVARNVEVPEGKECVVVCGKGISKVEVRKPGKSESVDVSEHEEGLHDILDEGHAELTRGNAELTKDKDEAYEESVWDVIDEGRAELNEEMRDHERAKKEFLRRD